MDSVRGVDSIGVRVRVWVRVSVQSLVIFPPAQATGTVSRSHTSYCDWASDDIRGQQMAPCATDGAMCIRWHHLMSCSIFGSVAWCRVTSYTAR